MLKKVKIEFDGNTSACNDSSSCKHFQSLIEILFFVSKAPSLQELV